MYNHPYNQPTYPGPGSPSPAPTPPLLPHQRLWQRFRQARRRTQWGLGCLTLLLIMSVCTCALASGGAMTTTPSSPTAANNSNTPQAQRPAARPRQQSRYHQPFPLQHHLLYQPRCPHHDPQRHRLLLPLSPPQHASQRNHLRQRSSRRESMGIRGGITSRQGQKSPTRPLISAQGSISLASRRSGRRPTATWSNVAMVSTAILEASEEHAHEMAVCYRRSTVTNTK